MPALPTGTLTLLFTDIEGSTDLVQQLGAERYAAALADHHRLLRDAFAVHHGHEVDTQGDAFFVVFSDARDALAAAIDAQRALAAHPWPPGATIRARMGLHTGEPLLAGDNYVGVALNRGARICSAGHGGQILLSHPTYSLVAAELPVGTRARDLGEHRLKDLRHAEHLFQVLVDGLPDVALPPRTAGQLTARDRIIVMDPHAPVDASRVDAVTVVERTVAETLAALRATIRGDTPTVVLTPDQVQAAAAHRPTDLTEYHLARIAEWSLPRFRLDGRFVDLSLLLDQGEDAASGRWQAVEKRYDDLETLLDEVPDPALVLLGPPGSGKSTLLRRLDLDTAIAAVRGASERISFFIQLNQYRPARPGAALPAPAEWLAERWSARAPDLPSLEDLLSRGEMLLLLDALNEMPHAGEAEYRERAALWKQFVQSTLEQDPGTRIVFSCRSLDYSAPLSTASLRVPQVQIEAMDDAQIEAFLTLHSPAHAGMIWSRLAGSPQLGVFRSPYFLKLLVDQVEATGSYPDGRAALFTGFVRQALRREIEGDNPLFAPDTLLAERDYRRVVQAAGWRTPYELPERGVLVPKLAALAHSTQLGMPAGAGSQVRVGYDEALDLLDHPRGEDIVSAGVALAVLDEDPTQDEVLFYHQLVQEYFAARAEAKAPDPQRVAVIWRAAELRPALSELIASLPAGETLPPLPTTGWEETAVLAAAMVGDPEAYIRGMARVNLALAGRCANLPDLRGRLPEPLVAELRAALVERSRDPAADLRHRIACALELGWLGDPRFERRVGPHGAYLLPPLVEVPGGRYVIGSDTGYRQHEFYFDDAAPEHRVDLAAFALGRFPVTNAEWACFMATGGYEDPRWWDTRAGRAWQRGEGMGEANRGNNRLWRERYRDDPGLLDRMFAEGTITEPQHRLWQALLALDDAAFEANLAERFPSAPLRAPRFWQDAALSNPLQPVVGISWHEARAYTLWLAAQTGRPFRLPSEVEWEAAARGPAGRLYAFGDAFDPLAANTLATRLRRTTPVGVFPEGDTPEGAAELCGNVYEWTATAWGEAIVPARFRHPYDPRDGREDPDLGPETRRVIRGCGWLNPPETTPAWVRQSLQPEGDDLDVGVRVAV